MSCFWYSLSYVWWIAKRWFPVTSWCLNVALNFVTKSAKVPRENEVPEMALWRKVAAQVRADPLVMYERAKAICLSSLS